MRTRFSLLFGLALFLAPAPLFAQSTVDEYQAFVDEYQADVEDYHSTDFATDKDRARAKTRLKKKIKTVLNRARAEYDRTTQFAVGYEGIWTVAGSSTQHRAGQPSEIHELSGEVQIERHAYPASVVTGPLSTPAKGEHLDVGYGDGEVYVIEFTGKETTPRKMTTRLRGWLRHAKSLINRDKSLTIQTLATGPKAVFTILESSSAGALEALGLQPTTAYGGVRFEIDGAVKGGGKSSFEALGGLNRETKLVSGRTEAGVTLGLGTFQLSLQDYGVKLSLTSETEVDGSAAVRGAAKLTRTMAGLTDSELEEALFQLNRLNLLLRYPRAAPVRYRSTSRNVHARFTPSPELDKNGVEAWVLRLIDSAEVSIDLAIFEFQLMRVGEALIRAQQRGVNVRVVHDADDNHEPPAVHLRDHEVEGDADTAMLQVRDDLGRRSLMHNKFMIIDGERVWTGSTNLTSNAMFAQDNNALLFRSKELAALYKIEFEEMFTDQLFGAMDRTATANTRWSFWTDAQPGAKGSIDDWLQIDSYTSLQVYFAPEDNAMDRLLTLVRSAKKSIRFMAFSFSSGPLADAMKERMQDGVTVSGLFEGLAVGQAPGLYQAGAAIRIKSVGGMKLHHKVIMIDDEFVCTGSFNFSASADKKNDENMVLLRSKPLARKFNMEFKSIWDVSNPNDPRVVGTPATPAQAPTGAGAAVVVEGALGTGQ